MKKERKRLNKKVVALVLALSMIFGQTQALFATESQNAAEPAITQPVVEEPAAPVEEQTDPAVPGDVQEPEAVTDPVEVQDPAAKDEEAAVSESAAPAEEAAEKTTAPAESTEAEAPAGDTPSANASGNKISLSGGTISVNIPAQSGNYVYSASENIYFAKGVTVSQATVSKNTGEKIGFDFKVLSSNASTNTVLVPEKDYTVGWFYQYSYEQVIEQFDKDSEPEDAGTIYVRIYAKEESQYEGELEFSLSVNQKPKETLSDNDLVATISNNIVTVSNNSKTKTMYFDLVSKNALGKSGNEPVVSTELKPGEIRTMTAYYRQGMIKCTPAKGDQIAVVASMEKYFNSSDYQAQVTLSVNADPASDIGDGYKEINMKAYVDRNSQLIKISWAPKSDLKYKTYELFRMNTNGEFEPIPDWKDSKGNTRLSKKNYAYKYNKNADKDKDGIERAAAPAVFKLNCYDADGKSKSYITVAAPSLLYVEPGYELNRMEFCFSKLYESEELSYRLEVAEKKVEKGENVEGKRGFEETKDYAAVVGSIDTFDIKDFLVKKGISVDAVRDDFIGNKAFTLKVGTNYFCRVKSEFWYKGVRYSSAPSNVLSRKAGPAKEYVFDVNGVKYVKPTGNADAKAQIERENAARMNEYITAYLKDQTVSSDHFTHNHNERPDAKSGYVVFLTDKNTDNSIKSFELLRSETQYGTYKKIKTYNLDKDGNPAKNSGLSKYTTNDPDMKSFTDYVDVYYMWYNNFPPEKTYYYAVRAVSRTGSAQGGFGDGYGAMAELDKVSDVYPLDGKVNKINIYWRHDDCVKKYKIYRTEPTSSISGDTSKFDPDEKKPDGTYKWTLIATVAGSKSGTLKESDKNLTKGEKKELYDATNGALVGDYNKFIDKDSSKKRVQTGHVYEYAIVPIYDVKNKDKNYNIDKVSDYAYGVATLEGVKIKNFKALNGGVHKVNSSWSKIANNPDIEYMVLRTTKLPSDPEKSAEWMNLYIKEGGVLYDNAKTGDLRPVAYITQNNKFPDAKAKVGQPYYYAIFAGDFPEDPSTITVESLSDVVYKTAKSVPLAAAGVDVRKGNNYSGGAYVTFTKNSADRDYWDSIVYTLQRSTNGGGWQDVLSSKNGTATVGVNDEVELRRGEERRYRVVTTYVDSDGTRYNGGTREGNPYSKPSDIEVNTGNTTIAVGEETKISVYARKDGGGVASLRDVDGSINGGCSCSSRTEGDHTVFTIKGNYRGTYTFTVKAAGWDSYTGGSSKDRLKKTVTITVK